MAGWRAVYTAGWRASSPPDFCVDRRATGAEGGAKQAAPRRERVGASTAAAAEGAGSSNTAQVRAPCTPRAASAS